MHAHLTLGQIMTRILAATIALFAVAAAVGAAIAPTVAGAPTTVSPNGPVTVLVCAVLGYIAHAMYQLR